MAWLSISLPTERASEGGSEGKEGNEGPRSRSRSWLGPKLESSGDDLCWSQQNDRKFSPLSCYRLRPRQRATHGKDDGAELELVGSSKKEL